MSNNSVKGERPPASGVLNPGWSVADAKARLSELVDKAGGGPQIITRNGKPVAVVVSIEEWRQKTERKGSLAEFFLGSPLRESGLDLVRLADQPRDIKL